MSLSNVMSKTSSNHVHHHQIIISTTTIMATITTFAIHHHHHHHHHQHHDNHLHYSHQPFFIIKTIITAKNIICIIAIILCSPQNQTQFLQAVPQLPARCQTRLEAQSAQAGVPPPDETSRGPRHTASWSETGWGSSWLHTLHLCWGKI